MKDAKLGTMLRRVMLMSMGAPLAVGAASCGGALEKIAADEDSGTMGYEHPDASSAHDARGFTDVMVSLDSEVPDQQVADASPGTCGDDAGSLPDANGVCWNYVPAPCGVDAASAPTPEECTAYCGADSGTYYCFFQNLEGHSAIECGRCAVGRRPEGYALESEVGAPSLGSYFAVAAELEAASVDAFLILRDELVRYGAPKRLVAGAERAARDEVRHVRMTASLAKRNGGAPRALAPIARRTDRSLEEIAIENAIEGCVRETYGALVAMWQAENAEDPEVRAVMKRVAVDETRHAALAWSTAEWMRDRLSEDSRARVDQALRAAVHELAAEMSPATAALARSAGLPSVTDARRLLRAMREVVWS